MSVTCAGWYVATRWYLIMSIDEVLQHSRLIPTFGCYLKVNWNISAFSVALKVGFYTWFFRAYPYIFVFKNVLFRQGINMKVVLQDAEDEMNDIG